MPRAKAKPVKIPVIKMPVNVEEKVGWGFSTNAC